MVRMEIKLLIYKELRREFEEPQILILTGSRQVGKTTILRALEEDARNAGKRTRFLDLEQPRGLRPSLGTGESLRPEFEIPSRDEYLGGPAIHCHHAYDPSRCMKR